MATVSLWSNVTVTMESTLGSALPITAITAANPGVVSSTGHGLNDGDYVLLSVSGMYQVDNRVFKVAGKTTDTFQLSGENTTGYAAFVSGNAYKVTFGTTLATLTDLSASGGDYEFIDVTTIHDAVRKQIPGVASPATYSFTSVWDVSDAGLVALKAAADNKDTRVVKFTFANGNLVVFNGYVGATLLPVGNAQDKVTTPVVITMFGRPTTYTS